MSALEGWRTEQVARLNRTAREDRVRALMADSFRILDHAIAEHVDADSRRLAGIVGLFSGGNDSTVMAHLLRPVLTHLGHANTGIGVEATRQFVRDTAAAWGLPLLERHPDDRDSYRAHVLAHGFPGPGMHGRIYQRIKERAIRKMLAELKGHRLDRVVFVAGRRRDESRRREQVPAAERVDAAVWASPMVHWTKADLNTYRLMHPDCPTNEVTAWLHMSGECLCGAFAAPGERSELEAWVPADVPTIADLEAAIADADHIPPHRRTWGWAAIPELAAQAGRAAKRRRTTAAGRACGGCATRLGDQ